MSPRRPAPAKIRTTLERLFARALRDLDPAVRVEQALARAPCGSRAAVAMSARPAAPVRIIAIGKASPAMAQGALAAWGEAVERCLVVAPDGTDTTALRAAAAARARLADRVEVMYAAHPLPDARSVRAGNACLAIVQADARGQADERTIVLLVSGGASSLACAPAPGITLRTKRAITRAMLESGASIQDINTVRKHLSRIKGGGLARAAAPRSILTLVASDVIGGAPGDVGSGPSVPDVSRMSDARRLLLRFAPAFADVPLVRTLAPSAALARRCHVEVVVSPEDLARAMAARLGDAGYAVQILPPSQAPVDELAAAYVALARRARTAKVFVRAAEPSVAVTAHRGRGGRSTHLAALVGRGLGAVHDRGVRDLRGVCFAALASDGVDGGSETGGAIIDGLFSERVAARLGPSALDRALARFDTGTLHLAVGTALATRATGHNLADLHVLVVA